MSLDVDLSHQQTTEVEDLPFDFSGSALHLVKDAGLSGRTAMDFTGLVHCYTSIFQKLSDGLSSQKLPEFWSLQNSQTEIHHDSPCPDPSILIHPLSGKIHEKSMACRLWSQTADGHTKHQGCQGQDLDASSRHRRESVTVVTVVTVPVAPHCHVGRKEWLRRQGERLTKSPKCRDIKNKLRWNKKEKLLKLLHGKSWHPIHRSNSGKTCVHGTSSVAHSLPQWPHGWNALAKSRAWRHAWQRMENNSLSSRSEVITVRGIRHWPFGTQMHKKKTMKRKRRRKKQRRRKHKKETGIKTQS